MSMDDGRTLNFPHRMEMLVWSAVMDSWNSGLRRAFEEEKRFRTVVFVSQRDEKTCFPCLELDGVEFDIGDTEELLPIHCWCRCQWVPKAEYEA